LIDCAPQALIFGLICYGLIRCGFDRSLTFFAFVLGTTFGENIRRSLRITRGEPTAYIQRPISAALSIARVLIFIFCPRAEAIAAAFSRASGGPRRSAPALLSLAPQPQLHLLRVKTRSSVFYLLCIPDMRCENTIAEYFTFQLLFS